MEERKSGPLTAVQLIWIIITVAAIIGAVIFIRQSVITSNRTAASARCFATEPIGAHYCH